MTAPTPLVETRQLGALRIHAIQAGGQKLDGGAMFGVVPKPLWERRIPADERNRIPLGMRCLLVEHADGLILVDTGAGNKETDKFHDIYGIENRGTHGPTALEDGLHALGFKPSDVAYVLNTHLHFDHAGGNTRLVDGRVELSFPNAVYIVQRGEYGWALKPNERTQASYFPANFRTVYEAGRMDLVEGEQELFSGIRTLPTPGHTPHHQSILVESGDEKLCFLGDLVPTSAHVPLPWIMGYDVEPLVTLESKRSLLKRALDERWTLMFEHDATVAFAKVAFDEKKGYSVVEEAAAR